MNVSALIEEFQSNGGVIRRFELGEHANYDAIILFLQRRGYRLTMERGLYKITGGRIGRPKRSGWKQIIEFVDELRRREGKQPISRGAA